MYDVFDKCFTDEGYFGRFRVSGDRFFTLPVIDDAPGPRMEFQGKENVMWSVNNYIGLSGNVEILAAAQDAMTAWSISGPMGSRMMSGSTSEHLVLEKSLAEFSQKEDAFVFNYGYMGVVGTVSALCGPNDTLIVDKLAHASIVDAAFSAKGGQGNKPVVRFFRHNDMDDLESVLKSVNKDRKGGVMLLLEGVYGMTGDLANLKEITSLSKKYNARIFIDDAHGIGVMGEKGRGTAAFYGVQDDIDIYFGTFAKAFAAIGGYAATSTVVRDWVAYNARTQVFAKSLPMIYVKALQTALRLVMDGDDRRSLMWKRSNELKQGLKSLGYHIGTGQSPICAVFVPVGDNIEDVAMEMLTYLRNHGIFCTGVMWPVIPPGLVLFRMIPTASHSEEDVAQTVDVFKNMREDLHIQFPLGKNEMEKIGKIYRNR